MYKKELDVNNLEVFAGVFESEQEVKNFLQMEEGVPKGLMENLYLTGDFTGHVEYKFFENKSNQAEELLGEFSCGERIIKVFQEKYVAKLKKKVNTVIVLYDFDFGNHFSNHPLSVMQEKKTKEYHIFYIDGVFPYKTEIKKFYLEELRTEVNKKIMGGALLDAFECYRQALRENPENIDLYRQYYECLENYGTELPEYMGDMITCQENILKILEREQPEERKIDINLQYSTLATLYFQNKDYEKALWAFQHARELGVNQERDVICEWSIINKLGLDSEKYYENNVCEIVVSEFCLDVVEAGNFVLSGGSKEQLDALKALSNYEFPPELVTYFRYCMPEDRIACSKKAFLLSFEDLCSLNSSYLTKNGFFAFAMTKKGDLLCLDLKDSSHLVYQISTGVCREDGIFFMGQKEAVLPLTYESIKMVSIQREYHLLLFLPSLKSQFGAVYNDATMKKQYDLRTQLCKKGYTKLEIEISEESNESRK